MKKAFVWVLTFALVGSWSVTAALAQGPRSGFAVLNGPSGDTSVQCGATAPFTMHITMTSGVAGSVRVKYRDLGHVDYAIPASTTVQISLGGGGRPGSDDIITVCEGAGGAVLIGQASLLTAQGLPHPFLGDGTAFCTFSPATPQPVLCP